jgi:hypothetical protein
MDAGARAIMDAAVRGRRPPRLGSFIRDQFADVGGVELAVPARDEEARAVDLLP